MNQELILRFGDETKAVSLQNYQNNDQFEQFLIKLFEVAPEFSHKGYMTLGGEFFHKELINEAWQQGEILEVVFDPDSCDSQSSLSKGPTSEPTPRSKKVSHSQDFATVAQVPLQNLNPTYAVSITHSNSGDSNAMTEKNSGTAFSNGKPPRDSGQGVGLVSMQIQPKSDFTSNSVATDGLIEIFSRGVPLKNFEQLQNNLGIKKKPGSVVLLYKKNRPKMFVDCELGKYYDIMDFYMINLEGKESLGDNFYLPPPTLLIYNLQHKVVEIPVVEDPATLKMILDRVLA